MTDYYPSIMGIREAKERMEDCFVRSDYHSGNELGRLHVIKAIREAYALGYKTGMANAQNNSGNPTQLDFIEAKLNQLLDLVTES